MDKQLPHDSEMVHQPKMIIDLKEGYNSIVPNSEPIEHEVDDLRIPSSSSSSPTSDHENFPYFPSTAFQTTISPQLREGSSGDDHKSDNDPEQCDEALRIPKVGSRGKVKTHKCKQCDFVAITKLDYWKHSKTHIKPERQLKCPNCPFVTEHKHHLEYHINIHSGSKPYKCDQCDYSCVNKYMLNSHLKSHSDVYQYRCANCSYATKYCHSLKLHLRKFKHEPAMVLNPDGTPNPLPVIDVYGRRRGRKKVKAQKSSSKEDNTLNPEPLLQNVQSLLGRVMSNLPPQLQLLLAGYPFASFPENISNTLLLHNYLAIAQQGNAQNNGEGSPFPSNDIEALDLSKPDESCQYKNREGFTSNSDSTDEEEETTMFSIVEVVERNEADNTEEIIVSHDNKTDDFYCHYCDINFRDPTLHNLHMGYHGYPNPFTCNMCREQCKDKFSFFLHIAQIPHT